MTGTCLACGRQFRCFGAPKNRCHYCRQAQRRAAWREAQRRRRAGAAPAPRACADCGVDITHRGPRARYCGPCAEAIDRARDCEQAHARRAARAPASYGAPRDLALEARIDAHLAHIRASRRFSVKDIVWARRVDPVAAEAQDLAGASLCLTVETRTQRERRGQRLAAAERRAVAAE